MKGMLEFTKKKMVITRKEHICYQCQDIIEKGGQAVAATVKEDDCHKRLHFHFECSAKHARAMRSGNMFGDFSVEKLVESEYPF